MPSTRIAAADPTLAAVVTGRTPLRYTDGADPATDRPAHVRAGSSLARVPGGIALVQDDANFIAVVDPRTMRVDAIPLPAGAAGRRQFDDGRGNKAQKLDLEACVAVHDADRTLLVALGSGSSRRREQVAIVGGWRSGRPDVAVVHVPRLYEALRDASDFAGSEMNVEGALHLGDRLRLFGRGNGAAAGGARPVNATCDLAWADCLAHLRDPDRVPPPSPRDVVRYELGLVDGIALGFTDAAECGDRVLFSAAAEDSPDATRDGRVAGSAIGVIAADGRTRWAPLTEPHGRSFAGKVEGLLVEDGGDHLLVVVDADDPDAPSELCTVALHGDWVG